MKKIKLILFFFLIAFVAKSQTLEVGGLVGGSYYIGDINPAYHFAQTNFAYGIVARYNMNSRWTAKLNGYKGVLKGDDLTIRYLPDRSLEFTTEIYEMAGIFEFNFLPYFTGSLKNFFTPYIFGGGALIYARPQIGNSDLRDYGTEGQNNAAFLQGEERPKYSYFNFAIPFGIGVKYSFSKRVSTSLEWGMRKTFTDYLDDVSTTYYLPSDNLPSGTSNGDLIRSDPNANHQPLQQRGYSKNNDWYAFAGLTITYKINLTNRNKCSEFENRY